MTAIVPTAGRPDLVRRAVGSVLGQTLRDLEVIVVVDGSGGEPLAVWNGERGRARMSNGCDWRASFAWAAANRELMTERAYAASVLVRASLEARRARDWLAAAWLVHEAFRGGRPNGAGLLAHALIWLLPGRARFAAAAVATRARGDAEFGR